MKNRGFLAIVPALTLAFAPQLFIASIAAAPQHDGSSRRYVAKLISPKAGDVLFPGQQVAIRWEATLPTVELAWCEVEIYLSLDGGRSNAVRLTPQLDPRIGYFNWTVPNLPTTAAVLDIHFGCEEHFPESPSVQAQSVFAIIPSTGILPEIKLNPVSDARPSPGSTVQISWNSSVKNVAYFELQISYDGGAHFYSVTETSELQFDWNVPDDFIGQATFRVVAQTDEGGHVASVISAEPQVIVRAGPE